jgi:hypothetical protein
MSDADIQVAVDVVVEILEALRLSNCEYTFEPILNTLDPARQPIEVTLAILLTTARHGYYPTEWQRAADRVKVYVERIQHPEWKAIGDMLDGAGMTPNYQERFAEFPTEESKATMLTVLKHAPMRRERRPLLGLLEDRIHPTSGPLIKAWPIRVRGKS